MADACVLGRIDLVRALARGGIRSVVVAKAGDPIRWSRHVAGTIDAGAPSLIDALEAHAAGRADQPPLFYDSDDSLLFVAQNRERLARSHRFVLPEPDLLGDLLDKGRFQALAERLGLPVPGARRVPAGDAFDPAVLGLSFPLVVKASPYRDSRWYGLGLSSKVVRVDSPGELQELLGRLGGAGIDAVVQELIPGGEHRIESYHVYVDAEGAIAGEFTGRKIRTTPREFGASTSVETTDDPEVAALGRAVVERLGFRGVAKLDFKRAPDGGLRLLEINPRFTLWTHPGAVAGVNLPALVHADLTGRHRPSVGRARPGVRWIWPRADLAAARADGMTGRAWLPWALRSQTNAAFALSDPMPYVRRRLGR